MPNVTGYVAGFINALADPYANGSFYVSNKNNRITEIGGNRYPAFDTNFNSSRSSNVYKSINEVRVKSIISIGFIKLY